MTDSIFATTLTGLVDLLEPDPATITIAAMAHGLAHIPRWAGALELPFSVAQHSVLVMEIAARLDPPRRPLAIFALLHDAHEYLIGDIVTPAARALVADTPATAFALARLKDRLDRAILTRFGLTPPWQQDPALSDLIAEADALAAGIEWRALMPAANGQNPFPVRPGLRLQPKALVWPAAADLFKATLEQELAAWHGPQGSPDTPSGHPSGPSPSYKVLEPGAE